MIKLHFDSTFTTLRLTHMAESSTHQTQVNKVAKPKIKTSRRPITMAETYGMQAIQNQPSIKVFTRPSHGRIIGMQASSISSSILRRLQAKGASKDDGFQVLMMARTWSSRSIWSFLVMLLVNLLVSMDGPPSLGSNNTCNFDKLVEP